MEIGVAYVGPDGNPFATRIVSATRVPEGQVALLSQFSQALWVVIAQKMLPAPSTSSAFADALADWTGPSLLSLGKRA